MAIPWCCPVRKTFLTGRLFSQPDLEENSMVRRRGVRPRGIKCKIIHPANILYSRFSCSVFLMC
ncbi:unnamed protein product [Tetraodon nigroviridis]|uniref:(spotted green pufferfish) hypothetical protein n=1 Tax=Tetraodon nigroviridis TaxID=99883 RepID=Q4RJ50_TETNG|nr:unnamed protein product [Tetraodon nigroviridis]